MNNQFEKPPEKTKIIDFKSAKEKAKEKAREKREQGQRRPTLPGIEERDKADVEKAIQICLEMEGVPRLIETAEDLLRAKQFEIAQPWLEKAIELQPDSARVWCAFGYLYINMYQLGKAIEAYTKATECSAPTIDMIDAHYCLGELYELDDPTRAILYYKKFLELSGPNIDPQIGRKVQNKIKRLKRKFDPNRK